MQTRREIVEAPPRSPNWRKYWQRQSSRGCRDCYILCSTPSSDTLPPCRKYVPHHACRIERIGSWSFLHLAYETHDLSSVEITLIIQGYSFRS
ncbi:hypothetical protein EUGRSUZ_J02826 [Eucalyptus grandis]|uniref:Uncharacterized protein n=2 Tax=Eucalyptus grandis TaxID=71139 RepID=A0ACC3J9N5_EUCGR|nr:hypothetical protein EUGRSUZ_J02826 [Eucalyptus grandis]